MEQPENEPASNPLMPHRDVEITDTYGKPQGVRIHELKVNQFERAAALIMDEIGLLELATGKPAGWVTSNVPPRFLEPLTRAVEEVNPHFFAFALRRMALLQRVMPGAVESILGRGNRGA